MPSLKTARTALKRTAKTNGPTPLARSGHRYSVGQTVRLSYDFRHPASYAEMYRIVATLPPMDGEPQYRLRNDSESFERVARQDSLHLSAPSRRTTSTSLIERTFGR